MTETDNTNAPPSLGILLGVAPHEAPFGYAVQLANASLAAGHRVYVYLLDDAVAGSEQAAIAKLEHKGAKISACAYAARKRNLVLKDHIVYGGLGILHEIILKTDRFVGFCH